jgi:triacylglycerol lipase
LAVVLLHGLGDTSALFRPLRSYLESRGRVTHALDFIPNSGHARLEELARQVQNYIERTFAPGEQVDLIGFSMGGIVARYYVQRLGGSSRVSRLITIGSPHRGTWTAILLGRAGVKQMRPGSAFLRDLNREPYRFTSIWTLWDLMIVPANSSVLPGARAIRIQVAAHMLMIRDRRVFQAVEEALLGGGE